MKKKLFFLVLFLVIFLSACNTLENYNAKNVKMGESFKVQMGETARISSESLNIKFVEVISDNRCPERENNLVNCKVDGGVKATFSINKFDNQEKINISTNPINSEYSGSVDFLDYNIVFLSASPEKKLDSKLKEEEYTAHLIVESK